MPPVFGFVESGWPMLEEGGATVVSTEAPRALTHILGDYPEVLGAVLPCYWIYWEVGKALLERGSPNPLYKRWIDTYGGEEFGALVEGVLDLTNRICENLNPTQKARTMDAFVTTSRYEWMFWDAAWKLEGWPVR